MRDSTVRSRACSSARASWASCSCKATTLVSKQESRWIKSAGAAARGESKAAAGADGTSWAGQERACSSRGSGAEGPGCRAAKGRSGKGRPCRLATSRRCSSATQLMRASVGWGTTGSLAAFPPMVQGLGVNPQHASARCYRISRHDQDSFRRKTQEHTRHTADPGNILELPDFQEMSGKSGNTDDEPLLVPQEERERESAGLQTALGVEIAGKAAVPASPPGPGQHQLHTPGSRPDEMPKQMTHFRNRQGKERFGM